jgi:hypothetical protein
MKATTSSALLAALAALCVQTGCAIPTVDESYPYTGPAVPIGDWVDPTINGNGKGFPRLVEPPAVVPSSSNPTNNINVIALSYIPQGINIHYQTPFGLGVAPSVKWGTSATDLESTATGLSHTYVSRISLWLAIAWWTQKQHQVFNVPSQARHFKCFLSKCLLDFLCIQSLLFFDCTEILEISVLSLSGFDIGH